MRNSAVLLKVVQRKPRLQKGALAIEGRETSKHSPNGGNNKKSTRNGMNKTWKTRWGKGREKNKQGIITGTWNKGGSTGASERIEGKPVNPETGTPRTGRFSERGARCGKCKGCISRCMECQECKQMIAPDQKRKPCKVQRCQKHDKQAGRKSKGTSTQALYGRSRLVQLQVLFTQSLTIE